MNLLLDPRHEHGADPDALRPEGIGSQAVAYEDGILRRNWSGGNSRSLPLGGAGIAADRVETVRWAG